MKFRKNIVPFKGYYVQSFLEGITDGRLLIVEKNLFRYPRIVQMLVESGKDFQLMSNSKLEFEFKKHDVSKLLLERGKPFTDSQILSDHSGKLLRLFCGENKTQKYWFDAEYVEPFLSIASRYEVNEIKGMMIIFANINGKEKSIAYLMGVKESRMPAYFKLFE